MANAKKANENNTGKIVAIVVAGVVALAGVVVAVLFATGVLGGPKLAGTYVLTGMKQGDQDMSSLLSLITAGGGEMSLEMKDDGTCLMKTKDVDVSEEEDVSVDEDGVEVDDVAETEPEETVTACKYDAKNKTLTIEGQTSNFNFDKDTITFEADGLTMIYTRKK